jgi:hypothetical protein
LDAGVDALYNWPFDKNPGYKTYFQQFPDATRIAHTSFQAKPDRKIVESFVNSILDLALGKVPQADWLSVPQLPYVDGTNLNKINRSLAQCTQEWKVKRKFKGKMILPIILTNQRQLNKKTARNGNIDLAVSCLQFSESDGIWVVDSSLNDLDGTGNFEHERFPGIIKFHEELNARIRPETITISGPHWGLNLILWARGLTQFTATGPGKAYQYHIPGGMLMKGVTRIALAPLRRLAVWSPELKKWIDATLSKIPKSSSDYLEFSSIERHFNVLHDEHQAHLQVARFYKDWFKKFEAIVPQGRALALYQDLSSAYVLGRSLKDLPKQEHARSASKVAKQLMVNCL